MEFSFKSFDTVTVNPQVANSSSPLISWIPSKSDEFRLKMKIVSMRLSFKKKESYLQQKKNSDVEINNLIGDIADLFACN